MTNRQVSLFALGMLLCLWAGLLVGVSFLATPAKFRAPSLELGPALDVGRQTFQVLGWVEWPAAALGLLLCLVGRPRRLVWVGLLVVCALLAVEHLWLLPVLDARVQVVLDGGQLEPSFHHRVYIAMDAARALLLLFVSVVTLRWAD